MEKILSPDERIKRAEELYYKRKIQAMGKKSARVNVSDKKEFYLFKKIFLQIIICILIYTIFYMIKNTNYIFSETIIKKTNQILEYDINIEKLYVQAKEYIHSILSRNNKNSSITESEQINAKDNETGNVLQMQEEVVDNNTVNNITKQEKREQIIKKIKSKGQAISALNQANIGGEVVEKVEHEASNLTQMEQDAKDILESKSFIIPLRGTITSRYGPRNPTTSTVPKFHTGIDIAVNEGTIFIASMSGIVEKVSSIGDYGNHIKIVSDDVMTIYAHCKTIYVKEGDKITQGEQLGEVGCTGNTTGPHLHFEIRKANRYVNPEFILKFD